MSLPSAFTKPQLTVKLNHVSVWLQDLCYIYNLASCLRACACYGVENLLYSGQRIRWSTQTPRDLTSEKYKSVRISNTSTIDLDNLEQEVEVVAFDIGPYQNLATFKHPQKAVYLFGAEDKPIPKSQLLKCHHVITIPTQHALSLSSIVHTVLYDRYVKTLQVQLLD